MSSRSEWNRFFLEAAIPDAAAEQYASSFTENRISMDMLLDLNKDYLRDLGIFVLGDIIAILRHAKAVQGKMTNSASTTTSSRARVAAATTSSITKKQETMAATFSDSQMAQAAGNKTNARTRTNAESSHVPSDERRAPSVAGTKRSIVASSSSSSAVSSRLGPPTTIRFADLATPTPSTEAPLISWKKQDPQQSIHSPSSSVFSRLDSKLGSDDEEVRRVHMSSSLAAQSPPAPALSKIIRLKRTDQERSESAFNRLDSSRRGSEMQSRVHLPSHAPIKSRLDGDVADRLGSPNQLRSEGILSSLRPSSTRTASFGIDGGGGNAPTKKKSYVLVRTLKDGTKIREKISEDDPILDKVKVKKVRCVSSLDLAPGSRETIRTTTRFGSLQGTSSAAPPSPPREPRKRRRITGPDNASAIEVAPRQRCRMDDTTSAPPVRKRISAPDRTEDVAPTTAKARLGLKLSDRLGHKFMH